MNEKTVTPPLPAATMPWGTLGPWEPPAEYGEITSPAINPTTADWPTGGGSPPATLTPFFSTSKGINFQRQQQFVFFGSYGENQNGTKGYLENPYDQTNRYGAPVGAEMIGFPQVTGLDAWNNQPEASFTVLPVPAPSSGPTNEQLRDTAMAALQQMKF